MRSQLVQFDLSHDLLSRRLGGLSASLFDVHKVCNFQFALCLLDFFVVVSTAKGSRDSLMAAIFLASQHVAKCLSVFLECIYIYIYMQLYELSSYRTLCQSQILHTLLLNRHNDFSQFFKLWNIFND